LALYYRLKEKKNRQNLSLSLFFMQEIDMKSDFRNNDSIQKFYKKYQNSNASQENAGKGSINCGELIT